MEKNSACHYQLFLSAVAGTNSNSDSDVSTLSGQAKGSPLLLAEEAAVWQASGNRVPSLLKAESRVWWGMLRVRVVANSYCHY